MKRVLQTPFGQQAHHIVPWATTNHQVIQKAASAGSDKVFHPNEVFNGISLPTSRHSGDHPNYSNLIQQRLNVWQDTYSNATPEQAAKSVRQWLQTLKAQIQNSTAHINDIVPPIISFVP
ncbi:MAG: AHH domain-containing protein [Saprospiraceae bacterium]|nr:AHH domain-containing protein [Saprospiraceae bacterium]